MIRGQYSLEEMRQASPSALDSYEDDVETAIQVLREEADSADSDWVREEMDAMADYFENEVLH